MHAKKMVGYSDPLSACPGETVRFMVSCEPGVQRYRAGIVRLLSGDDQPGGPGMRSLAVSTPVDGDYPARLQPVRPGSWDGSEMNWTHQPDHYAATHFLEDALDDCHWQCVDATLGTPAHALVLASSEGHGDSYLHVNEMIGHMYLAIGGSENPAVRADMVFFETAGGGAVWSTGSIAWASALPCTQFHNDVARITGNVLRRFVDAAPFGQDDIHPPGNPHGDHNP